MAKIWSAVCIDGHEVVAKYIDPNNDTSSVPDLPAERWYAEHVRESQYLLQVRGNLFTFNNVLFSFRMNFHSSSRFIFTTISCVLFYIFLKLAPTNSFLFRVKNNELFLIIVLGCEMR